MSGGRSAKDFETLLHTAAIGSGNSGGALVDACGRVIGINSFGTVSNGGDAEFFFAIANREVRSFLSRNKVAFRSVDGPCLSRAELCRAEAERDATERAKIEAANREADAARTKTLGEARKEAEYAIIEARENRLLLTILLLIGALGAAGSGWQLFERERRDHGKLAYGGAAALLIAALLTWVMRPGFDQVDERAKAALKNTPDPAAKAVVARHGAQICTIDRSRSRDHHFRSRRRKIRLVGNRLRQQSHPICRRWWPMDSHFGAQQRTASVDHPVSIRKPAAIASNGICWAPRRWPKPARRANAMMCKAAPPIRHARKNRRR